MHLRDGAKYYWLMWNNDWLGDWDHRPVNPMHLREDSSCFSLKWKNHWWGLEHEQFDEALLVVTNSTDLAGISCLWLSPSCTCCRPGRVAKGWFVITPVLFFELGGLLKAILASGDFMLCGIGYTSKYAISLYRYDVCIYSGNRGEIQIFIRETLRSFALYFSPWFLLSS